MATILDRLLLGGTLLFGGLVTRKIAEADLRLHVLERTPAAPSAPASAAPAAPAVPAALPAMPLPTGYGLQVVGPAGEELLLPVCLPPGFELDALVLRPAFLAADVATDVSSVAVAGSSATVAVPVPAPVAPPSAAVAPPRERLRQAIQLVYEQDATYRTQIDVGAPTEAPRAIDSSGLRPVAGDAPVHDGRGAAAPAGR